MSKLGGRRHRGKVFDQGNWHLLLLLESADISPEGGSDA